MYYFRFRFEFRRVFGDNVFGIVGLLFSLKILIIIHWAEPSVPRRLVWPHTHSYIYTPTLIQTHMCLYVCILIQIPVFSYTHLLLLYTCLACCLFHLKESKNLRRNSLKNLSYFGINWFQLVYFFMFQI